MMSKTFKILHDCYQGLKMIFQGQFTYRASALAFTTLLSLVPMVSLFVYAMTQFEFFSKISMLAKNYVISNFVPATSGEIVYYLGTITQQASKLPTLSIAFLLVTTILLIVTIDKSILAIWPTQDKKRRITFLFAYPFFVLFIPIFIGLGAILNSLIFLLLKYIPGFLVISFIVPLLINAILITFLYVMTVNTKAKRLDCFIGASIASLLLLIAKFVFVIYINHFSNYAALYGALASIPIFLMWLYIFWLIILYGAIIVKIRS